MLICFSMHFKKHLIITKPCFKYCRIDIEAVVTETDGSRTLSAAEAIKLINPEIVNDHLKSDKFNVRNIATGELRVDCSMTVFEAWTF